MKRQNPTNTIIFQSLSNYECKWLKECSKIQRELISLFQIHMQILKYISLNFKSYYESERHLTILASLPTHNLFMSFSFFLSLHIMCVLWIVLEDNRTKTDFAHKNCTRIDYFDTEQYQHDPRDSTNESTNVIPCKYNSFIYSFAVFVRLVSIYVL